MRITLCTSPHLDRSALFDGRSRHVGEQPVTFAQTFLPMGLLSLASAVKDMAQVCIFDINKHINSGAVPLDGRMYADAADLILVDQPDVVGLMTECDSFHHVIRLCSSLKASCPRLIIVLGCVHASYNATQILSRYPFVDYVIRGEGEVAFRDLIQVISGAGSLSKVGNLTYRNDGAIVRTAEAALIPDLDMLPWIEPDLVGLQPADAIWVEIGRGCPFKCNFCVTAPYWHRRHRIKSPDRIIAELTMFRNRYGRHDFNFTHDLFTTDRRWVLRFCTAMAEADLGVTWTCSSRTDTLDEEQLAAMSAVGCRDIYFGVESGSPEMQRAIDKSLSLPSARQIIALCHQYGVSTTIGFIAGLPGESETSLRGTLDEAAGYLQLAQTTVHLFGFGPYRGSTNFETVEDQLVTELDFVDFPLDPLTSNENRALISAHRDVFARYSRLSEHASTGFVRTLEVAEEYFPILNSLPALTAYFFEKAVDPYAQLKAWVEWLDRHPPAGAPPYHSHLGCISDFIEFARHFSNEHDIGGDRFDEILRWETLKQTFRSEEPSTVLSLAAEGGEGVSINPTVRIEEFYYAPHFTAAEPRAQSFAFLRCRDGQVRVVRVGDAALSLIELTRAGARSEDLEAIVGDTSEGKNKMRNLFAELAANELVLTHG